MIVNMLGKELVHPGPTGMLGPLVGEKTSLGLWFSGALPSRGHCRLLSVSGESEAPAVWLGACSLCPGSVGKQMGWCPAQKEWTVLWQS